MDFKVSKTSRLFCNLGHHKVEQQTPIPPNQERSHANTCQPAADEMKLPVPIEKQPLVSRVWGIGFPFMLSMSVGLDVKGLKWFSV